MVNKYTHSYAMTQVTRAETFRQLFALIYPILESNGINVFSTGNRLMNLLAKGLLFDQCDKYCYERATGQLRQNENQATLDTSLNPASTEHVTASLFNWIQSLKEDDVFRNKFIDKEVKIVQRHLSEQDGTLLDVSTAQNQRERLDSTFVKTPVTTQSKPVTTQSKPVTTQSKSDPDKTFTTEVTSSALPDQPLPTTTVQATAVPTTTTTLKNSEVLLNGSVRSVWGDAFVPSPAAAQELSLDTSSEVVPAEDQDPAAAAGKLKTVSVEHPSEATVSKPMKNETCPSVSQVLSDPSAPHPSANPALWGQPGSNTGNNLNSSIRDSYADFINEQSIARRDYNQLMEQLQEKQQEAQALRSFLQGGTPVLLGSGASANQHSSQGMSGQQDIAGVMSKSVDQNFHAQQALQQIPEKLPYTDRGPPGAPPSHPIFEQSKPNTQAEMSGNKPLKNETQTKHEKIPAKAVEKHENGVPEFDGKPQDPASRPSPFQHEKKRTGPIVSSMEKPPTHQLPIGFAPFARTDDPAVIRSVAFHPRGHVMAVGSNSSVLKLCSIPEEALVPMQSKAHTDPNNLGRLQIVVKKSQVHRGSIYALAWNDSGSILSTCSNDKLVKIFTFNEDSQTLLGPQYELTHHDGMVRDISFLKDYGSGSVLASGGSVDFVVYTYACEVDTVVHQLTGHSDQILSLYSWNGGMLVSASQDRSVRIWDLRSSRCVSVLGFGRSSDNHSVPLCVCVDEHGRYMGVGRDDSLASVYDLRASRLVGDYTCHKGEVRSVRFNPTNNHSLLSSSYDGTAVVTDINALFSGTQDLASCSRCCNFHNDKVIQCRWHNDGTCFATTSADQTCVLWGTVKAFT